MLFSFAVIILSVIVYYDRRIEHNYQHEADHEGDFSVSNIVVITLLSFAPVRSEDDEYHSGERAAEDADQRADDCLDHFETTTIL